MMEPDLGLCTVRVVDVREGICVALQRWVGETQRQLCSDGWEKHKDEARRKEEKDRRLVHLNK
jgi:hypothetical protein